MKKHQTRKDLKDAIDAVRQLADDAIFGRLVDTASWKECPGEINAEWVSRVVEKLEPEFAGENEFLRQISNDEINSEACHRLCVTRDVFFQLGLLMGARLADPSGRAFESLASAWIRSKQENCLLSKLEAESDDAKRTEAH